ncbi:MAG: TIGR02221 family CRISPR-associated protein [Phycisphaerae bacterium]
MARKVLISFIGTGPSTKPEKSLREYRTAKYKYGSKIRETTFVASALMEFLECKTIFLFGTMKSMWEEVYRYYCERNKLELDESYYFNIAEKCGEEASNQTSLTNVDFKIISESIANDSMAIPIPYGLDQSEIEKIFQIFTDILSDNLKDGDEIYLDITHSFRSLPIYAQTTISFLTDVLGRNISFKGIYYGMLEVNSELGYAPIVDLSYMLEIQKFTKGAYAFEYTGNANLLYELLVKKNKTVSEKLKDFTQVISLNFIHDLKSQISVLTTLGDENDYELPEKLIVPVAFKKFRNFFKNATTLSDYQFLLAKWHYNKSAYALSYLCLVESIISFSLERNNRTEDEVKNERKRDAEKGRMSKDLCEIYGPANQFRKVIAHVTEEQQEIYKDGIRYNITPNNAIQNLKTYINAFDKIRKKC